VRGFVATRLETLTKESNMHASLRVRNPGAKRKRGGPEEVPEREEALNVFRIEGRPGADPVESEYA